MMIFAIVWIPASLVLEIPLRTIFGGTLFAQPESFLKKKPGVIGKIGMKAFRDDRDWFQIYYTLYLLFVLGPAAIYMVIFCTWDKCFYQAGVYYVLLYGPQIKFFPQIFGALHTEAHMAWKKTIYTEEFAFLSRSFEYGYGTLWGHIPELSGTCHVKLHHAQNGSHDDTESLLAFNRLSAFDYPFKFLPDQFTSHALNLDAVRYFYVRENWTCLNRIFYGSLFYSWFAAIVLYNNPLAALFLVAVPLGVFNMITTAATWTQHTFVYKEDLNRSVTVLLDMDTYEEFMHLSHQYVPCRELVSLDRCLPLIVPNISRLA